MAACRHIDTHPELPKDGHGGPKRLHNTLQPKVLHWWLAPKATAATMTALRSAQEARAVTMTIPAEVFRKSGPCSSLTSVVDSYDS